MVMEASDWVVRYEGRFRGYRVRVVSDFCGTRIICDCGWRPRGAGVCGHIEVARKEMVKDTRLRALLQQCDPCGLE